METEKKYLKTIEEVSDALAAGKVLYNRYNQKIWKDKNGFIVSDTKYLNVGGICVEDELYILEPKPLEVKLWHLYEDKNGYTVFIVSKYTTKTETGFIGLSKKSCPLEYNSKGELLGDKNIYLVKELADLSQYFKKEPKNEKND